MKIGVLGYGHIGKALSMFYIKPLIRDVDRNDFEKNLDVLNVCIPDSISFVDIVKQNIIDYNPKITIIHSTVAVGKTKQIVDEYEMVVHSPISGKTYEEIKHFTKFIGCESDIAGKEAKKHLKEIGLSAKILRDTKTTELAKLLDTTYYGLCIAYHDYADDLCKKFNVEFQEVMTGWNEDYNRGYGSLDRKVVRPVLYPPKGEIVSGCVIKNSEILKETTGNNSILETILNLK